MNPIQKCKEIIKQPNLKTHRKTTQLLTFTFIIAFGIIVTSITCLFITVGVLYALLTESISWRISGRRK